MLANIEVSPEYRGKSFFTSLMEMVISEPKLPFECIEIEAVQNERFATRLERNGFKRNGRTGLSDGAANSFSPGCIALVTVRPVSQVPLSVCGRQATDLIPDLVDVAAVGVAVAAFAAEVVTLFVRYAVQMAGFPAR
ncbi:GNAT family N-acetyltransferase [Paraburkholderia pallida]|uniref:Uncharacterized protein n=1 Tax=Paraburkholderia pallida TaxID=2547399 RepID=A0A4P7D6L7_9BURK|nr:GNAT family N-acetyltransferase [Paraburkholderia pallida]QBR04406.1 hypothetical protein E1956_45830 [Paraburkholderia pallida]